MPAPPSVRLRTRRLLVLAGGLAGALVLASTACNRIDYQRDTSNDGPGPPNETLLEAARNGRAHSQHAVGVAYLGSDSVARDAAQALYWLSRAAERGHGAAQSRLGQLLMSSYVTPAESIEETAGAGRLNAASRKAAIEARRWLLASSGSAPTDFQTDPDEGLMWLEKAAMQGDLEAALRLALARERGEVAPPDRPGAARWYRPVAQSPGASGLRAQVRLARLHDTAPGSERDAAEAATWYRLAAERGHAPSQARLAELYTAGDGVHPRYDEAARWARASAEQNDPEGCYAYAVLYLKGFGVKQDFAMAVEWYRRAANGGHAVSQNMLGTVYLMGDGVEADPAAAERWWRMAAEQGYAPAQFNLGGMFSREISQSLSKLEAEQWLEAAADQQHRRAKLELAELRAQGPEEAEFGFEVRAPFH